MAEYWIIRDIRKRKHLFFPVAPEKLLPKCIPDHLEMPLLIFIYHSMPLHYFPVRLQYLCHCTSLI